MAIDKYGCAKISGACDCCCHRQAKVCAAHRRARSLAPVTLPHAPWFLPLLHSCLPVTDSVCASVMLQDTAAARRHQSADAFKPQTSSAQQHASSRCHSRRSREQERQQQPPASGRRGRARASMQREAPLASRGRCQPSGTATAAATAAVIAPRTPSVLRSRARHAGTSRHGAERGAGERSSGTDARISPRGSRQSRVCSRALSRCRLSRGPPARGVARAIHVYIAPI